MNKDTQLEIEQLKFALNASEIGTWDLNPNNNQVFWDDNCRKFYGLSTEQASYEDVLDLIHPEDRERVNSAIFNAINPQIRSAYDIKFRVRKSPDNKVCWLHNKGKAYFSETGRLLRFSGIAMDISREIEAIERLQEAESMANAALKGTGVGLFSINLSNNEIKYSPAFSYILTGQVNSGLSRKDFIEYIHPDDLELREKAYRKAQATGDLFYEARTIWENGSVRMVRVVGNYMVNPDGKTGKFTGTVQDITEQHEREVKFKQAQERLSEIVRQAPVAISLLSGEEMIIETANKNMLNIWRKDESVIGRPLLKALPELEDQPFLRLLKEVYRTGKPFYGYSTPARLSQNGVLRKLYFDFSYTPVRNPDGKITNVMVVASEVTQQVMALKAVEASENRFRGLIEEAPFATAVYAGHQFKIETANEAMLRLWGKDESVIGKKLAQALPELEGQPFLPLLDQVYTTGKSFHGKDTRADLVVNGELRSFYFNFVYKPLKYEKGKVYAILNMAVDVTDQVMARKKLEDSEIFAKSIIENSPVAKIVFIGREMMIETVNERMLRILGKDRSIIGKNISKALPKLKGNSFFSPLSEIFEKGITLYRSEEIIPIYKDGELYDGYFDFIYKPLFNSSDQIYGVIVTAIEITEQVLARKKIKEAEEALRSAVELARLGTWSIDLTSGALDFSERLREWSGFGPHEILTEERSYEVMKPEFHLLIKNALLKAVNEPDNSVFDVEYEIQNKKTGEERIIHALGKAFFNEGGKAYKIAGTAQDVSKQKHLQLTLEHKVQQRTEELQILNEKLKAKNDELFLLNERLLRSNQELEQYAYVASHDLQEPLRKIRMFSDMLGKQSSLAEYNRTLVEKINNSASRMSLLIRDLLEFSRLLNSEKLLVPVSLEAVCQWIIQDFELSIREKNAEIILGKLPQVYAVPLQMNQLFYNLMSNALKFSDKNKKPLIEIDSYLLGNEELETYGLEAGQERNYYKIIFSDNGIGFEKKYAEQIFDIFKRLHGKEIYPGSGIGLALCRRIVSNHQGLLFAESEYGKGTRFHIILPEKPKEKTHLQPETL